MGQARKKGVLGMSQVKKGVFTAAHTCTGHIMCPPPPQACIMQWAGKTHNDQGHNGNK